MREVSFEESKDIMIKILKSIDNCCREHNIKYSVCWGTMIGAIRHQGFIPWDDDIDIMMPREDYNRFLAVYGDSEFGICTPKMTKNYRQIITKIHERKTCVYFGHAPKSLFGVWVSIFPYDNAPDKHIKMWEIKRNFWMDLYHIKISNIKTDKFLPRRMAKIVLKAILPSSFRIYNQVESCLTAYNRQHTQRVCIWYGATYKWFRYFPKELFDECIDVDFETIKTKIIKGYDKFMRQTYGDYMQFPPESERVPKHNYKAYFIE